VVSSLFSVPTKIMIFNERNAEGYIDVHYVHSDPKDVGVVTEIAHYSVCGASMFDLVLTVDDKGIDWQSKSMSSGPMVVLRPVIEHIFDHAHQHVSFDRINKLSDKAMIYLYESFVAPCDAKRRQLLLESMVLRGIATVEVSIKK
jgi:hypothetical protein